MRRMSFSLPSVRYLNWASADMRETWQAAFEAAPLVLAKRWLRLVACGAVPATTFQIRPFEIPIVMREARDLGIVCRVCPDSSAFLRRVAWDSLNASIWVAVGSERSLDQVEACARGEDETDFLRAVGWPDCCAQARSSLDADDPIWSFVLSTESGESILTSGDQLDWHPFLRRLRLAAIPHVACGHDCRASKALASQSRGDEPVDQILSWGVTWSALHGLAEVLLPVAKLVHETDATPVKHTCTLQIGSMPERSPQGVVEPFRHPHRRPMRETHSFRAGVATVRESDPLSTAAIEAVLPPWPDEPPTRPVILQELADDWPAISRWSFDFLSRRFSEVTVKVRNGEAVEAVRLPDFLASVQAGQSGSWYLMDFGFEYLAPEMLEDFHLMSFLESEHFRLDPKDRPGLRSLYIGGAGSGASLHTDILDTCAYNTLIVGEKYWYFCTPSAEAFGLDGSMDLFDRATRERLCLKGVRIFGHSQQAGETLYVPSRWWHQTRILKPSIALTGNILHRWNAPNVSEAIVRSRGHPILGEIGRRLAKVISCLD